MLDETGRGGGQLVINFAALLAVLYAQHVQLFLLAVGLQDHMLRVVKIYAAYRLFLQLCQVVELRRRAAQLFGLEAVMHAVLVALGISVCLDCLEVGQAALL